MFYLVNYSDYKRSIISGTKPDDLTFLPSQLIIIVTPNVSVSTMKLLRKLY